MDWITIINGLFGVGGLAVVIIKLIEIISNQGKAKEEARVLKSEASVNITEAAQVAVGILERALSFKASENQSLRDRLTALEENQEKSSELRAARDKQIADLQAQFAEAQEANDALQSKLAAMEKQIEKDTQETAALRKQIAEIEEKYKKQLRINARLVKWFEEKGEPLPDLNGDIGDSIRGFKWDKK